MRLFLFFITFISVPLTLWANSPLQYPLDTPMALSASFGELRPNHFHAGIDLKTEQRCGLPVFAVADGYVSRIKIAQFGYGNCLYLTHPSLGITTVYAHLDAFNDTLTAWLEEYQYAEKTFQLDVQFPDTLFPVKQGQLVAISGNTGSSGGPHVHFEVRNEEGTLATEPLAYFPLADSVKPKFRKIGVRPLDDASMIHGNCGFFSQKVWSEAPAKYTTTPVEAWGKVGLEFMAFDYMNGQNNYYGLKRLEVYVDSVPYFTYQMDQFLFDHDKAINAFIDYEQWVLSREVYMCAYMPQYQPLSLFWSNKKGVVEINQERDYKVTALAFDYAGNKTEVSFVIRGKKAEAPLLCQDGGTPFYHNTLNYFQEGDVHLLVPRSAIYNDFLFKYTAVYDSTLQTVVHSLHNNTVPLHKCGAFQIPIAQDTLTNKDQYYLAYKNTYGKWGYVDAAYQEGAMIGNISKFGDYVVLTDTIPPTVTMLSKGRYKLVLRIADRQTDISSYNGYIDNQWVLFSIDAKNRITYHYDPKRIKRGKHTLRVEVVDRCGNKTEYITDVILGK